MYRVSPLLVRNIYFLLRFGLANPFNDYLRLKVRVVWGPFLPEVRFIFVHEKSLKRTFKAGF